MKFLKKYHLKDFNFILVISVLILSIVGILAVGSASPASQTKQIFGVVFGLGVMFVISIIDYTWVLNFYWVIYAVNLFLLLYVEFFGASYNNAQRWINLGFTTLQPSDLTKIFVILFYARFLMDRETRMKEPKVIISCVLLIAPSLFLILKQPNLSNTLCIAALFCVLMYLGGLSYKFIGTVLAIAIPCVIIFLSIAVMPDPPFLEEYQQLRILAWLYPEEYASTTGFQQQNSIIAIGSGQLQGKGLNNNTTTSVKNGNFLLEADRIRFCGLLWSYIFDIINYYTMYYRWLPSAESCRSDYLRRSRSANRTPEFHQYWSSYWCTTEYRFITSVCQCGSYIHCLFLYGNWFCFKCWLTAKKILKESSFYEYWINCT